MSSLLELPDETILEILSSTHGGPLLYMNLASTCKRFKRICTSDTAWERFNVYRVTNIYRHFLAERDHFTERERALFCSPAETWCELLDNNGVDQLNPYTQLLIMLAPMMFGSLFNQITSRRVMELGVLEPGNLLFYGCDELKMDPELVYLSFRSRQHRGIAPPKDWSPELKLNWHFAYANLDSELQSPYPAEMYDGRLDPDGGGGFWGNCEFLVFLKMDAQTKLRISYLTTTRGKAIKMGDQYLDVDNPEVQCKLARDADFQTAALDSGVPLREFHEPSTDIRIRAAARGGIREAQCSELPSVILAKHNSWALHRSYCRSCQNGSNRKSDRPSGLFRRIERRKSPPDTCRLSFRLVVAAARRNAYLCENYCATLVDEHYTESEEFQRAEREAKLNGRYPRPESRKYCQIEWFLRLPVDRPFVQKDHPAVARYFEGFEQGLFEWDSDDDCYEASKERFPAVC